MTQFLLLLLFCGPFIGLLIAKRYLPLWLALYLPFFAWAFWIAGRPHAMDGFSAAMGLGMVMFSGIAALLLLGFRLFWIARQPNDTDLAGREVSLDWRPLWGSIACILCFFIGEAFLPLFQRLLNGGQLIGLFLLFLLLCWAGALRLPKQPDLDGRMVAGTARMMALWLACTSTITLSWLGCKNVDIAGQAVGASKGLAYCIEVTNGKVDYLPVRSLLDLNPLRVYDREGLQSHALLYAHTPDGVTVANWSYYEGRFNQPHKLVGEPAPCTPVKDFVGMLPLYQ